MLCVSSEVLDPILFSSYVAARGTNSPDAEFYLNADDAVIYCWGSTA